MYAARAALLINAAASLRSHGAARSHLLLSNKETGLHLSLCLEDFTALGKTRISWSTCFFKRGHWFFFAGHSDPGKVCFF